jgi:hypothetical protein
VRIVTIARKISGIYNPETSSNRGRKSLAAADNQVNATALTESIGEKIGYLKAQPVGNLQAEGYELSKIKSPVGVKPEDLTTPLKASAVSDSSSEHNSYSLSDLLYRETHVLGGVKEIVQGAKNRAAEAIHDWPLTAVELASGVAIGSALVLASRNPALAASMRILNRTMLGFAAADLTSRVAIPSYDALVHPQNLEADRHDLGNRLGAAVVDYGMAAVAGGIGSRAVTPLIERTGVGSMVAGYDFFKMPSGAEVRVFKSGNALISRNGVKVFRTSGMDFDDLDPTALGKKGIVGNNDQLRRTFQDAETHPNKWREGKDIEESAGKFGTWFETMTGALASEVVERSVDVGIGLLEHDYLKKTLETPTSDLEKSVSAPVDKTKDK